MSAARPIAAPTPRPRLEAALRLARDTRSLLVGSGAARETGRIFSTAFPGKPALLVADFTTLSVAGQAAATSLAKAGIRQLEPFVYSAPDLYAEFGYMTELEKSLHGHHAIPVALGSGTINDLVKLATHRAGRPGYLCVATAASMDGYTAFGASITAKGSKQTFDCPAPCAVVADVDIIRRAPPEMTAAGYADLAAKITAGADWILADALDVEPLESSAWRVVQEALPDALADPAAARNGDAVAIGALVEGLMLGGFAMQAMRSSRPASGAEHQFSHLWDMEQHVHHGAAPSHGFKVGVATLAVTRLYELILGEDLATLDVDAAVRGWPAPEAAQMRVDRMFSGTNFHDTALAESSAKHISPAELRTQLLRLQENWTALRSRLQAQLLPADEMERRLRLAGAPTEPEQIGVSRRRLRDSFFRAYHIRRRFTVLDLAVRTGLLDTLLQRLFGRGGVWEISP